MFNPVKPGHVLENLLTLKFPYSGEELISKIEDIKYDILPKITDTDIRFFIMKHSKRPKTDYKVTLWLPKEEFKNEDFSLKDALIQAAIFPKEYDCTSAAVGRYHDGSLYENLNIHKQLAYAVHYNHPRACFMLNNITNAYLLTSYSYAMAEENKKHGIYTVFSEKNCVRIDDYEKIELYFDVPSRNDKLHCLKKIERTSILPIQNYLDDLKSMIVSGTSRGLF